MARVLLCALAVFGLALASGTAAGAGFAGRIAGEDGEPVVGAMATFRYGSPFQERTVFSDADGHYRVEGLAPESEHIVRVRRIGWRDLRLTEQFTPAEGASELDFTLVRETDPAAVAAQLPANRWYGLVLDKFTDERHREQLVRQCTFCHQQGNRATRLHRDPEEWDKLLALMGRMGAGLDDDLRAKLPEIFNAAYDPAFAVPALTRGFEDPGFAPPPSAEVRQAVIDEYELGGRSSMQHDIVVHPSGHIYSVDMMTDTLFRLDPREPGGRRESFPIPRDDVPLGGVFGEPTVMPPNADSHVGPHSLQVGPDGAVWITLALGNRLARFDPADESWTIEELPAGLYPHTLRIDDRGRIWYTIAVSNHVGMYDPASGQHEVIRVPARSFGEEVALRVLPAMLWLSRWIDISAFAAAEGDSLPVPYGIDFAPDGGVWFSQLNAHRIGRVDPDSFEVEMIDTPFTAPRRMRFDSQGRLWIPGFSSGIISRFDLETREFTSFELPIEPAGTDVPYALNVDRRTDTVWICGTNSDTLIRFDPLRERFTVYPLPTRVTYTREVDFDEDGAIWTSNSNMPAWQIETGVPRIVRLDPSSTGVATPSEGTEVASRR